MMLTVAAQRRARSAILIGGITISEDHWTRTLVVALNLSALICLYGLMSFDLMELSLWAYGVAQIILYVSHVLYLKHTKQFDLLDALNVLNLGLFLHLTLAPFLIHYGVMPTFYHDLWNQQDIPTALLLIQTLGVVIQIGYYIQIPRQRRRTLFPGLISEGRLIFFTVAMIVLTVLGGMFPLYSSDAVFPVQLLQSGIYITASSLVYALPYILIILRPPQANPIITLTVLAGIVYSAAVSLLFGIGSKSGVANIVVAGLVYVHYFRQRMRVPVALLGVVAGVCIVTYMNYVRAMGYFANLTPESLNPFASSNNSEIFWAAGVAATLTPFEAFLVILRTFPSILPFQHGQRFLEDMIYPFLPRLLFPDKPPFYGAAFFWDYHLGYLSLENKVYEAISLPGQLYLDFGIVGLILCGLLIGIIYRHIYQWLIVHERTRGSVCFYALFVVSAMAASRAFAWTTYFILANVITSYVVIRVLHRQRGA